jgi:rod shape-determining protein MreD
MDNVVNRTVLTFAFSLVQSLLLYLIARLLLGDPTIRLMPGHELLRGLANAAVGIPLFYALDRFKTRD